MRSTLSGQSLGVLRTDNLALSAGPALPDEISSVVERVRRMGMKIDDSIRRKTGNRLLAAMPAGIWEDLKPHLE